MKFEIAMFALIVVIAVGFTALVAYGLVTSFCPEGLLFIPVVIGLWVIAVYFYLDYVG